MIVIGTVILSRDSNLFENITKDLSMACISVQSPLKGLYLRKFLTDSILSIHISDQLALHSTFFDFLLTNFSSINRLWIKTRFYVGELEAYDEIHFRLKFFIHSCLNRISDSINTDGEMYGSVVLPKILDEIICCKDIKSQEILLSLILISFHFKLNISNIKLILNRIKDITTGYNYFIFVSKFCDAMERYFILEEENIKHPETEIKKLFTHVHDYARFCPNPLDKNIFVAYNGIFKIAATLLIRDEKFIAEIVHACYEFFCASVVEEIEEETRVFIRMLCSTKISLKFILSLDCLYSFLDGLNPIDKNQYLSQIGQTSCVNHVFVTQNEVDKFFDFLNYMLQTETLAIDACKKSSKYFKNNVIKCYDFLPVLFLSVEFEHISLLNENSLKFISIILKTPQKYHHLIIPSLINQILKNIIKFNTVTVVYV
uniref:Vacuolar protein sorting-associated protein 35 (Trinotate prediction) n=1 Tax=Henneguya salminicola TaxID=69463 RepID=A0A6G3MDX1_HENSL